MACSVSFHFLQAMMLQDVLTSQFTINQLHVDFITKDWKHHYRVGQLKVGGSYYKSGQVLQSGTAFI